jgi:hypothetical protein
VHEITLTWAVGGVGMLFAFPLCLFQMHQLREIALTLEVVSLFGVLGWVSFLMQVSARCYKGEEIVGKLWEGSGAHQ